MADKINTTKKLYIGLTNSDNKLRKLVIPNPTSELTEEEIRTAVSGLITNVGIFDTDTNERFSETSITTSYTETVEKIELDIR